MYMYLSCSVTELVIERSDYESFKTFLSLKELAQILTKLSDKCQSESIYYNVYTNCNMYIYFDIVGPINFKRKLAKSLKKGEPNLIVTAPGMYCVLLCH